MRSLWSFLRRLKGLGSSAFEWYVARRNGRNAPGNALVSLVHCVISLSLFVVENDVIVVLLRNMCYLMFNGIIPVLLFLLCFKLVTKQNIRYYRNEIFFLWFYQIIDVIVFRCGRVLQFLCPKIFIIIISREKTFYWQNFRKVCCVYHGQNGQKEQIWIEP